MSNETFDYIIVGQGLAGSALAFHLFDRDKKVMIIDKPVSDSSSQVAAGIFNPITGRKMVKTWMADDLFPYLENFYKRVERKTGASFLCKIPIYRPFVSVEEQNEWMGKTGEGEFSDFIDNVVMDSKPDGAINPFGGLELKQCGYLQIPSYLKSTADFFRKKAVLKEEQFDLGALTLGTGNVNYKGIEARKLIFCEGAWLTENPFFHWLPLAPVKGEILFFQSPLSIKYILNRGVFVLPLGNGQYKVGSTYDHHDLTKTPTAKGRTQIEQKLQGLISTNYQVTDHIAGVRPATRDRRPFVGLHPDYETIGVFNGLGTKGVSLAPYLAKKFVEYMEDGKKLDEAINIKRYFSLYSE